jgi:hypothetical protein
VLGCTGSVAQLQTELLRLTGMCCVCVPCLLLLAPLIHAFQTENISNFAQELEKMKTLFLTPTPRPTALPTTSPTALPTPLPTKLPSALPTTLPTVPPTPLRQRVYSDNGNANCECYCQGISGGPWNNELPVAWNGARCVGYYPAIGSCLLVFTNIYQPGVTYCECEATGAGWRRGGWISTGGC